MTKQEIIDKVRELNLPKNSFVVFGSCPLAAHGLRESNDVDMLVSKELFLSLKQSGWQQADKADNDRPLAYDVFDVYYNWDFSPYSPTLEHLLETADVFDGIPFASLQEVRKWKVASGRPKDFTDVELINNYLLKNP